MQRPFFQTGGIHTFWGLRYLYTRIFRGAITQPITPFVSSPSSAVHPDSPWASLITTHCVCCSHGFPAWRGSPSFSSTYLVSRLLSSGHPTHPYSRRSLSPSLSALIVPWTYFCFLLNCIVFFLLYMLVLLWTFFMKSVDSVIFDFLEPRTAPVNDSDSLRREYGSMSL